MTAAAVLVTGATGCVGRALTRHLSQTGQAAGVRALVRSLDAAACLPAGIAPIVGTLDGSVAALRDGVRGATVIFHAAAKVHDARGSREEFDAVNVEGTRRLLAACDAEGSRPRIVFFSTVAVYGEDTPPEGVDDDAPLRPATPYAASKAAAEALVGGWAGRTGATAVLLRVATVYGPHDRGNMARMMAAISRGRFVLPGAGANRKTCAAAANVARAAANAANAARLPVEGGASRMFVVADPAGPYRLRDLADEMARALGAAATGRRPPAVPVPALLLTAGVLEAARGENAPLTRAQVRRLAADNVYRTTRLAEILGADEAVSLSDGMADAAAWWKAEAGRA